MGEQKPIFLEIMVVVLGPVRGESHLSRTSDTSYPTAIGLTLLVRDLGFDVADW